VLGHRLVADPAHAGITLIELMAVDRAGGLLALGAPSRLGDLTTPGALRASPESGASFPSTELMTALAQPMITVRGIAILQAGQEPRQRHAGRRNAPSYWCFPSASDDPA
jgi:hypothetical protein